jgi:hypothetical protein
MTKYERSLQIWSLLICAARERKSFTYGQIAEILSMGGAGVMANFLGPIMWCCDRNGWPALTVLVVNKDTGLPGDGLVTVENVFDVKHVNREREKVFKFDWFTLVPPTVKDFELTDKG